ncbi:MAG: sulfatase-like hydrolase/transferase [Planctomycetota bacterium]
MPVLIMCVWLIGLGWVIGFGCSDARAADEASLPNVMVFLVDDMGVMDTSVPFLTDPSGAPKRYPLNDYYRTPSMERLASSGTRFNQFYAMSVCSPTRISIMTGQNAARHRTTNWINPAKDNAGKFGAPDWNWNGLTSKSVTLAGLLREKGYRTIHVGKGHFGPTDTEGSEPLNLGFDVNVGGAAFGAPGSYYGEQHYGAIGKRKHHAVPHLERYHDSETFLSEALTIEAKKRVTDAVADGEPFFLYFAHYAVHAPFQSDPRYADNYVDSGKPAPAQAFATLIEGMDDSLGEMLDHFTKLGVSEETLVIFLGDNGSDAPLGKPHEIACAAPLRGKKGAHYEGGMRVPMIASWAKRNDEDEWQQKLPIARNAIQSQVASVEDLFPTLLNLVDVQAPKRHIVDGTTLSSLLTANRDPKRPEQFLMHYPHGRHRSNYFTVWRNGNWKVIHHLRPEEPSNTGDIQSGMKTFELFDLDEDPFESNDLSTSRPRVLRRMIEEMREELAGHQAVFATGLDGQRNPPELPTE